MTISREAFLQHVELFTSIPNDTDEYGQQVHADLTRPDHLRWKKVMAQSDTINDELINISSFHRISCKSSLSIETMDALCKPLLIACLKTRKLKQGGRIKKHPLCWA